MSLRDIDYKEDYRSGYDNFVADFFAPSLRQSKSYWRAVGYFSSSSLEAFGAPLGEFIRNGGEIRLVTSVELSESDIQAIENGAAKQMVCAQRINEIIHNDFSDNVGRGVVRLARLIEMGRLSIQIAVPKVGTGIYHEKIGLFFDRFDFVAFTGSSNESRTAFENNRECIDVFTSWNSQSRANRKKIHFEKLWNGEDQGVEVFSFPKAAEMELLRICSGKGKKGDDKGKSQSENIWRHQDEAVEKFLKAERGILNLATGTGKTRTAIKILSELFNRNEIDTVITCTDGNDLLDQWYNELLNARKYIEPVPLVFRQYGNSSELQGFELSSQKTILITSRHWIANALSGQSRYQAQRTLLIHDEVHGLGSAGNRERLTGLSEDIRFRLGLSATPERAYDHEGNIFIEQHIGPVLMTFGVKEAIERGILCPFNYFPLPFEPTDDDRERIKNIHKKRKALELAGTPMSETEMWIELSRVYKTSEAKLPIFADFIGNHKNLLRRCIIFVETKQYGELVLEIVHHIRDDFHTYFSGEDVDILDRFANGDLECLISCHRLSEGIDIHTLNTVVLFSSEKGRLETIQRIGRCLRTNPNEPEKIANVVDFIRTSRDGDEPTPDENRRDWLYGLSKVRAKFN